MSFQKVQPSFPSNFASICSAIKNNSSVLFLAQTLYTLVKSSSLKFKFLRFTSARVKICQIPHISFELTSLKSSSNFASFFILMTHNSPLNFKLMHFLFWIKGPSESPNSQTFERALVKICQILHVILESTSQFSFKFCINLQCNEK